MTINIEKERAAFEANVANEISGNLTGAQPVGHPWYYYDEDAQSAWLGWQARAALVVEQEPVAWIPVHPRSGPLWGSLITSFDQNRPSYPLMPLYTHPQPSADDALMVDINPPATSRDRWMYKQGQMAERDPRSHASSADDATQTACQVKDLSLLVARLAYQLHNAQPSHELPAKANDYLRLNNLLGSPLRYDDKESK